ncbi:Stp1/IreP family PP2C-type Ser/Thr phosphatase [Acidovorax sp. Leaf160]|uniref:Stp1/IreP family PP2C-type Ser/Thr phosphatase n=1 Tax=Acidovorax sp. Leaf160 TaxID=1736280 RepID=UPI0007007925|nr:Stp1/IreP family PP2C-type Ser/Thr phosphatase [Acidovorax sp. Leaf160]KQR43079.1 protein phosphatase [Acidovorax sp. Leaf160]
MKLSACAGRLEYEFSALSDRGRVRGNNEDAVAVLEDLRVAVLADGMGGYNAGEVASSMATEVICSDMTGWLREAGPDAAGADLRRALETAVTNANYAILSAALAHAEYSGMGTTLVVGVFQHERLILGHIGDSRCYRWRSGTLQQITRDHSWLQEQIDAGLLSPEEAAASGYRNLVTRALGVDATVQVEINEFPVQSDDLFLFCSDGLTDMVADAAVADVLSMPLALPLKAARLVELANEMGGRDNITVLLVQSRAAPGSAPKSRSLLARLFGKGRAGE